MPSTKLHSSFLFFMLETIFHWESKNLKLWPFLFKRIHLVFFLRGLKGHECSWTRWYPTAFNGRCRQDVGTHMCYVVCFTHGLNILSHYLSGILESTMLQLLLIKADCSIMGAQYVRGCKNISHI
jgi:hypothetical protein